VAEGGCPSLHLPKWTESQVNVIYDTSGHKASHVLSTIPSLSPSNKPSSKLGEWLGMEDFKVRAYGAWKAYSQHLLKTCWNKGEYYVEPNLGHLEILMNKAGRPLLLLSSLVTPKQRSNTRMSYSITVKF
jgi:hypothetical protein